GELAPEDPVEGSEASAGRSDRGKHAEHIAVHPHVHGTRTDSHGDPSGMTNLSAEEPDALMRARPGLWERWGATPSATRPEARSVAGYRPGAIASAAGWRSDVSIRSQCSSLQDSAGAHFRSTPRSRFSRPLRGPVDGIRASASRRRTCASSQLWKCNPNSS